MPAGLTDRTTTHSPRCSYDEYLTSFITADDLAYLDSADTARRIIELGYLRGNGQLWKRGEFDARKAGLAEYRAVLASHAPKPLVSAGRDLAAVPLLAALAQREPAVRKGSLATIVFLRDRNGRGQEVSGFIDFGHRLAADEDGMEAVFAGRQRLLPQPGVDLSTFNFATGALTTTPSLGFEVMADLQHGLAFKNRKDRKLVVVDPGVPPGDYSSRVELETDEYQQVVLFDHVPGRRT